MHIVQLTLDSSVFKTDAASDSLRRQRAYAELLADIEPGSRLTNFVLARDCGGLAQDFGPLAMFGYPWYRLRHIPALTTALLRQHRSTPIDLVTTQNIHGLFWAAIAFSRITRVPVVGQYHDDLASDLAREANWRVPYGRLYEWLVLRLVRQFDGMRVVNRAACGYLRSIGYRNPVEVLPVSGIHPAEAASPPSTPGHDETGSHPLRVLFVGRLVAFKNLAVWIDTAAAVLAERPDAEFVVVGDGAERQSLEARCDILGITGQVRFTGAATPDDVFAWYDWADVFLLTSRYEGFGRVVLEAMHQGVIPVCSKVSGPIDIIEDGVTGFLEPPVPERLAARILALASDGSLLQRMSAATRDRALTEYNYDHMRRNWIRFLVDFARQAAPKEAAKE